MKTDWISEIVERSENGPYIKESDFDLMIVRAVPQLVKKHGLKFDPDVLVPADDAMADRLYQAGLELLVNTGVYNQSTERRIIFTKDESLHVPQNFANASNEFVETISQELKHLDPCFFYRRDHILRKGIR